MAADSAPTFQTSHSSAQCPHHRSSMDQQFQEAAAAIKTQVNKTLTDEELKEVYALYKQATCGDVAIDKPGIADIKYLLLCLRKYFITFIFIITEAAQSGRPGIPRKEWIQRLRRKTTSGWLRR